MVRISVKNQRKLWAGPLVALFGLSGVYFASDLTFGAWNEMGPGFQPTVFSWIIVVIGGLMTLQAFHGQREAIDPPVPRPVFMIFLSVAMFALLIDRAGMLATVFVTALTASFARRAEIVRSLVFAIVIAIAAVLIFVVLLRQPIDIWPEF